MILKCKSNSTFVNRGSKNGTALQCAVERNSKEIVKRLLSVPSINPYLCNRNNKTPIMIAIDNQFYSIIAEFIRFYDKNILSQKRTIEIILEAITKGNSNKKEKEIDDLIQLLETIFNIEGIEKILDEKNQHIISNFYNNKNIDIKIIQFLVNNDKIDINACSYSNEEPPLILAIKAQRYDIVDLLIKNPKININKTNTSGETALHHAVRLQNLSLVKSLLSFPSINPNLFDNNNKTPIMLAVDKQIYPIINEFIQFYGKNIIILRPSIDYLFDAIVGYTFNPNLYNNARYINYHHAKQNNNQNENRNEFIKIMENILNLENANKLFDEANQKHFYNICSNKNIDIKFIQKFLSFDTIDVNFCSLVNGDSLLISALRNERIDIAELLINDPRTEINMLNYKHESALTVAVQKNQISIINLLINNEKFNQDESRAISAFAISNGDISQLFISLDTFDVNRIIYDDYNNQTNRYASHMGWGSGYNEWNNWRVTQKTALINAAKNNDFIKMKLIINHPTFDKEKSKLYDALQILLNNNQQNIMNELFQLLIDKDLIEYCLQNVDLFDRMLNCGFIDIILKDKVNNFDISDDNIIKIFQRALNVNDNSIKKMTFLYNYDKKHNNVINLKKYSFLTMINHNTWGSFKNITTTNNIVEDIVNFIVENGGDANKPINNIYPLEHAINNCDVKLVNALLKTQKIDLDQCINDIFNQNPKTYLQLAVVSNSKILKLFLDLNHFDVNLKNRSNETPLMIACRKLNIENVKLLFERDDLDFHFKNNKNEDAIQIVQNMKSPYDVYDDNHDYVCETEVNTNESNDDLTKSQFLAKLLSAIKEARQKLGYYYNYGYQYYNKLDEEEEEEDTSC